MLVDVFLLHFLSKNLMLNLKLMSVLFRNIYKCIELFHFLHKVHVFYLQDFLNKNLKLNLKHLNEYVHIGLQNKSNSFNTFRIIHN